MNERNYELAKQAGLYHKTTLIESAVPLDQMLDKFAELIVKEWNNRDIWNDPVTAKEQQDNKQYHFYGS